MDYNTRLAFLNEDIIVVYQTKLEGRNWCTSPRLLEAFFIRTKDGSLLSTQRWPATLRKSEGDLFDSEARLIPLDNGRFLVFANGEITLYGPNLELLRHKKLEPSTDLWSAQSVADGKALFLRHESVSGRVTYSWLDSDTLDVKYEMPGYQARDFTASESVTAGENSVFADSRTGIRMIDRDQRVRTICDDPLCQESGAVHVLSSRYIGWSGRNGVGIIDTERGGLVWSRIVEPQYRRRAFEFGEMKSAVSGKKFALWVVANKKAFFDEVEIKPETILIYDATSLKDHPTVIRMKPITGDWCLDLSPSGAEMALFDGARVLIYKLD